MTRQIIACLLGFVLMCQSCTKPNPPELSYEISFDGAILESGLIQVDRHNSASKKELRQLISRAFNDRRGNRSVSILFERTQVHTDTVGLSDEETVDIAYTSSVVVGPDFITYRDDNRVQLHSLNIDESDIESWWISVDGPTDYIYRRVLELLEFQTSR